MDVELSGYVHISNRTCRSGVIRVLLAPTVALQMQHAVLLGNLKNRGKGFSSQTNSMYESRDAGKKNQMIVRDISALSHETD